MLSKPVDLARLNLQDPGSYQSHASDQKFQSPPSVFGSHNADGSHLVGQQSKNLPAEMPQSTGVVELSGTTAPHR